MGKTYDLTPISLAEANKLETKLGQVSRERPQVIEAEAFVINDDGESLIENPRHAVGELSQIMRHGTTDVAPWATYRSA